MFSSQHGTAKGGHHSVKIDVLQSTWRREGRALPCADRCPPATWRREGRALLHADGCPPVNMAQGRAGTALWRRPSLFLQEPDLVQHLELEQLVYKAWLPVACKAGGWGGLLPMLGPRLLEKSILTFVFSPLVVSGCPRSLGRCSSM